MRQHVHSRRHPPVVLVALTAVAALLLAACTPGGGGDPEPVDVTDWEAVTAAARGQTVRWWMFGGDAQVNQYVDEVVAPAAADAGIQVERVPVDDTADAVGRILAERRAGRTDGGSVDLVWVNGDNFATGKEAGIWLEDWSTRLPNAALVDFDDPTVASDFGVPVDGQEAPWSRALFVLAHDTERLPDPPGSFEELLAYARENPGRFTYPAPPDFTGSAFVRQAVQALGEDEAFELLTELRPLQWRGGEAFPGNEAELSQLFGDGQVDLAMSYNPGFARTAAAQGQFPASTRLFLLDGSALQNTSYVAVPANAANREGALVLADLLLSPELQAAKADPDRLGIPTVLDLDRLDPDDRARFAGTADEYSPPEVTTRLDELPPDRVAALDERWRREVLRAP